MDLLFAAKGQTFESLKDHIRSALAKQWRATYFGRFRLDVGWRRKAFKSITRHPIARSVSDSACISWNGRRCLRRRCFDTQEVELGPCQPTVGQRAQCGGWPAPEAQGIYMPNWLLALARYAPVAINFD